MRQANIAHGPQQVNNAASPEGGASHVRETKHLQNKLWGGQNGERLDTTEAGATVPCRYTLSDRGSGQPGREPLKVTRDL